MFLKNNFLLRLFLFFALFQSPLSIANPEGQAPPLAPSGPNTLEKFFPFIIIGLLFYILLILPQQKRRKRHEDFLSKIKRGDKVLTASGIYGQIEGLTDRFVILEVDKNVRIRIVKSQIASLTDDSDSAKKK